MNCIVCVRCVGPLGDGEVGGNRDPFFSLDFRLFFSLKLMGVVGYDLNIRRCVSGHFYFWVRPIITAGPLWFQISAVHIGLISHR